MEWISTKKSFKEQGLPEPKPDDPYLAYGNKLDSHTPGKDIVKWNKHGQEWTLYHDAEYFFRDEEIDFVLPIMKIKHPNESRE